MQCVRMQRFRKPIWARCLPTSKPRRPRDEHARPPEGLIPAWRDSAQRKGAPMSMLTLSNLHAFYGKSHILHGVELHVGQGEIVSLLGRNGSGRSTAVKTIMGL